jgi:hypothetical protein
MQCPLDSNRQPQDSEGEASSIWLLSVGVFLDNPFQHLASFSPGPRPIFATRPGKNEPNLSQGQRTAERPPGKNEPSTASPPRQEKTNPSSTTDPPETPKTGRSLGTASSLRDIHNEPSQANRVSGKTRLSHRANGSAGKARSLIRSWKSGRERSGSRSVSVRMWETSR